MPDTSLWFSNGDVMAMWLTFKLALVTSMLLLVIGTPIAWWLSRWQHAVKPMVQAIIALPLILPPTVLGFYLLVAFSPDAALGQWWFGMTGKQLAFSFEGIVIGSMFYSLPFVVQPLSNGFSQLNSRYLEVAHTLGLTGWRRFIKLVLPLTRNSFATAAGLSFAHTVGEFGVVLMIGGNIPGETQVLSIALFDHVEALEYQQAHTLALGLLGFSMVLLAVLYRFNGRGTHQ